MHYIILFQPFKTLCRIAIRLNPLNLFFKNYNVFHHHSGKNQERKCVFFFGGIKYAENTQSILLLIRTGDEISMYFKSNE